MSVSAVQLECGRPHSDFDKSVYKHVNDRFCNAIVIPPEKFTEMGCEPFSYVEITPKEENLRTDKNSSTVLYAVPFNEETSPTDKAAISTNLMRKIHPELGVGDTIELQPVDADMSDKLTVSPPYSDTESFECYISESAIDSIDVTPDDKIEVVNPNTGARVVTHAHRMRKKDDSDCDIRLRLAMVKNLDIEVGDDVKIRRYVETTQSNRTGKQRLSHILIKYILGPLVGYRTVPLRVRRGLPRDERRNIVRIPESTRRYLGVSTGDMVSIAWKQNQTNSQCLPPVSKHVDQQEDTETEDHNKQNDSSQIESYSNIYKEYQPNDIAMPSTVRDTIEVSPGDSVRVNRYTWDIFQKQIGISIIGILGVVFGTFQFFKTTGWFAVVVGYIGRVWATVGVFTLSILLSIIAILLIFLPVRGEV